VLDHLRGVVEEGPTDGGVMGVGTAMDVSRGRCFLRARHELASVALQAVVGKIAGPSEFSAGLNLRGEGRQVGRVPAAKAAIVSRERAWRRWGEPMASSCRILSIDVHRRQACDGDTNSVPRLCSHAAHTRLLSPSPSAFSPQSRHLTLCVHGRRMTLGWIEVPESERAAAADAKFRSQALRVDRAHNGTMCPPPVWFLCNMLFHVPCAGGHP
jgi:hypothetical protein